MRFHCKAQLCTASILFLANAITAQAPREGIDVVEARTGAPIRNAMIIVNRRGGFDTGLGPRKFRAKDFRLAKPAVGAPAWGTSIEVWAEGYAFRETIVSATPATVSLEKASRIEGIVRDPTGRPLAGAAVRVARSFDSSLWSAGPYHDLERTSDRDGRFTVDGLPSGKHELEIVHPAHPPFRSRAVELSSGRTATVDLRVRRGIALRGRLRDTTGSPIWQATLHLSGRDNNRWSNATSRTDIDGRFSFRPMEAGRRALRVQFRSATGVETMIARSVDLRGLCHPDLIVDTVATGRVRIRHRRPSTTWIFRRVGPGFDRSTVFYVASSESEQSVVRLSCGLWEISQYDSKSQSVIAKHLTVPRTETVLDFARRR